MRKSIIFLLVIFSFSIFSCTSNVDLHSVFVQDIKNGNYEFVYSNLEQSSKKFYSQHDDVLKMLDLGLLAHYSNFSKSSFSSLVTAIFS